MNSRYRLANVRNRDRELPFWVCEYWPCLHSVHRVLSSINRLRDYSLFNQHIPSPPTTKPSIPPRSNMKVIRARMDYNHLKSKTFWTQKAILRLPLLFLLFFRCKYINFQIRLKRNDDIVIFFLQFPSFTHFLSHLSVNPRGINHADRPLTVLPQQQTTASLPFRAACATTGTMGPPHCPKPQI